MLIVQPTLAAMIYASNSKPNCYTGFSQVTAPDRPFKYIDFLSA